MASVVDAGYFRRTKNPTLFLYGVMAAQACTSVFVLGTASGIEVGRFASLFGAPFYLALLGWGCLGAGVLMAARGPTRWENMLAAVPALTCVGLTGLIQLFSWLGAELADQSHAMMGSASASSAGFSLETFRQVLGASLTLLAMQLLTLNALWTVRTIERHPERQGRWLASISSALAIGVVLYFADFGDRRHMLGYFTVLTAICSVLATGLALRERAAIAEAARSSMLGCSTLAVMAVAERLWRFHSVQPYGVSADRLASTAEWWTKADQAQWVILGFGTLPLVMVGAGAVYFWVQGGSTSNHESPRRRFLGLLLAASFGVLPWTATAMAKSRTLAAVHDALSVELPADVQLTAVSGAGGQSSPSPSFAIGRQNSGFITGTQWPTAQFQSAAAPSLADEVSPEFAQMIQPLLLIDKDLRFRGVAGPLNSLASLGTQRAQLALAADADVTLPEPFDTLSPPPLSVPFVLWSQTLAQQQQLRRVPRVVVTPETVLLEEGRYCSAHRSSFDMLAQVPSLLGLNNSPFAVNPTQIVLVEARDDTPASLVTAALAHLEQVPNLLLSLEPVSESALRELREHCKPAP